MLATLTRQWHLWSALVAEKLHTSTLFFCKTVLLLFHESIDGKAVVMLNVSARRILHQRAGCGLRNIIE